MGAIPEKFLFLTTEDGSPSLRLARDAGAVSEAMHSLRGAFSETDYIYGSALREALQGGLPPSVLSLGLGLGYNEILSAALFSAAGVANEARVESFESEDELRARFASWIRGEREAVPLEFNRAYDDILARAAGGAGLEASAVLETLRQWLATGRLDLRGPLGPDTAFACRFSCFLFDAFSSKTTPELWREDFLAGFLDRAALPRAVFSTYACTGALKRALRARGFTLRIREGFASKRDSTFAVR